MMHHPLTHHHTLSFGQSLDILDHQHVALAHDHKQEPLLLDLPQISSIQVAAINDDGFNLSYL